MRKTGNKPDVAHVLLMPVVGLTMLFVQAKRNFM
jgi:hypothetical protein